MFYKNEKGSYTVEFSLLLPLVVIIVVFFVEISHYNYVRHISTQAVVATCGEGYDTGYYYCSFYDEVEPLVGLIPDAMRPIEIRIDTLQRKTTELRELLEQLEQLGD